MADPATASYRPLIAALARDLVLNATIPTACYFLSKIYISRSELTALMLAIIFPTVKSAYDLIRGREVSPVSILVLLGIVTSIVALFLSGDPRMLLIRESLFTGAFGVACLISLLFPRPIMFYFGRYFMAGKDSQKRKTFDARWQIPVVRRAHRLVTTVWGVVYAGEFAVRAILVYSLASPVVLMVSPLLIGIATMATIIWTFRYAYSIRAQISPGN